MHTNVVTISFGTPYWANIWLQETASPFPLFLDPQHISYRLYGLSRSRWRSWSPRTLFYYARAWQRGQKLHTGRGDAHQLGGDFIVDAQGIIRLAHASQDPTDRPSVGQIVQTLQKIDSAR